MAVPAPPSDTVPAIESLNDNVIDLQNRVSRLENFVRQQFAVIQQQMGYTTHRSLINPNFKETMTWEDTGGLPPDFDNRVNSNVTDR